MLVRFPVFNWAATWENRIFANAKTKTQISFAVTSKLISVFVFATWIVQSLCFLNPKFQVPSHLLRLRSLIYVGPGRKPRRPVFWRRGSIYTVQWRRSVLLMDPWWDLNLRPLRFRSRRITGVYRSVHYCFIFALKQRLWVVVRTASLRWF